MPDTRNDMMVDIGFAGTGKQQSRRIDPGRRAPNLEVERAGEGDHQFPAADVAARRKLGAGDQLFGGEQVGLDQSPAQIFARGRFRGSHLPIITDRPQHQKPPAGQ